MLRWLRYILDVFFSKFEPYCKYSWNEPHLESEECRKCKRTRRRWGRIWRYRNEREERRRRQLPEARLL